MLLDRAVPAGAPNPSSTYELYASQCLTDCLGNMGALGVRQAVSELCRQDAVVLVAPALVPC
jgi:hypothetical protein